MLHVKQQPVVTAVRQNFDADGTAQMRPQANLFLTTLNGVFEFVVDRLHVVMTVEIKDLANQRWHFGVEGPAWNEVLHGHGIVASAQSMLQIKLVSRLNSFHVELDA